MIRKINVIDLDKTLLTIDSLRQLLLYKLSCKMLKSIFLRATHLISRSEFCANIVNNLDSVYFRDEFDLDNFLNLLMKHLDHKILELIKIHSDPLTENIILSASPDYYVSKLSEKLRMKGFGSKYEKEIFFHCYADNKILLLEELYPKNEFQYHMAISDSPSDINLLRNFQFPYIYDGNATKRLDDEHICKNC